MEARIASLLGKNKREESSKRAARLDDHLNVSCQLLFNQRIDFTKGSVSHSPLEELKKRYKPLNRASTPLIHDSMDTCTHVAVSDSVDKDGVAKPKVVLFDDKKLLLHWKKPRPMGAGLSNLGNTCFLNSVLQCLMYTPPLFNHLTGTGHANQCKKSGFCSLCELEKHIQRSLSGGVIKPIRIVQNLKAIGKHFRLGSQEDAHEFLRYFVDSMQKSCLEGLPPKLDVASKATTLVHSIFGGYLRSRVKCLECMNDSDTYDQLLDLSLDVKNSQSIEKALYKAVQPDILDGANKYACPSCKRLCKAKKYFTIHRLPRVMTLHLKRFSFSSLYGSKLSKVVQYGERLNLRPFTSSPKGPPSMYRLYAVLVHSGFSCHSGHYFCFIRNSNNFWHCMNDSSVRQASLNTVLNQEAYLLFYVQETPPTSQFLQENAITEKTAPPTKKSEENGPLTKKSEENGPLTKKSEENGPLTKKSEENGPLMKKSEENGPPTKKSEENGPLIKKSRQKIFYGPELPLKSPPMNGQTSSNAEVPKAVNKEPTTTPTAVPSTVPTVVPATTPTGVPSTTPTGVPSVTPTTIPTTVPATTPTSTPTGELAAVSSSISIERPENVPIVKVTIRPKPTGVVNPSPQKTLTHSRLQQSLHDVTTSNAIPLRKTDLDQSLEDPVKPKQKSFPNLIPRNVTLFEKQKKLGIKPLTHSSTKQPKVVLKQDHVAIEAHRLNEGANATSDQLVTYGQTNQDEGGFTCQTPQKSMPPASRSTDGESKTSLHVFSDVHKTSSETSLPSSSEGPAAKDTEAQERARMVEHTPGLGMLPPTLRGDPSKVAVVPPTSHIKPVARVQPSIKNTPTTSTPQGDENEEVPVTTEDDSEHRPSPSKIISLQPDRKQLHVHKGPRASSSWDTPTPGHSGVTPSAGFITSDRDNPTNVTVKGMVNQDSSDSRHKHKKKKKHKKDKKHVHEGRKEKHSHTREERKEKKHSHTCEERKEKKHSHAREERKEKKQSHTHEEGKEKKHSHTREERKNSSNPHQHDHAEQGQGRKKHFHEERATHSHHKHNKQSSKKHTLRDEEGNKKKYSSHNQRLSISPHRSGYSDSTQHERKRKASAIENSTFSPKRSSFSKTHHEPTSVDKRIPAEVVRWEEIGKSRKPSLGSVSKDDKILEHLKEQSTHRFGSTVKSWDGGDSIVDSHKFLEDRKRGRSQWDAEYDKGKVKKAKKVPKPERYEGINPFQKYQNKRNDEVPWRRPFHTQDVRRHHSGKHQHQHQHHYKEYI